MSDSLLHIYAVGECDDEGYPIAWHRPTTVTFRNNMGAVIGEGIALPAIKDYIRELAGHRCVRCGHPYPPGISKTHPRGEWTPCDDECRHGGPVRIAGGTVLEHVAWEALIGAARYARYRILTVHHLNGHKGDCRWWNLAALCQRCHLTIQGRVVMERAFILEHSEWFKPYAAGWYAAKYLDEDLTREETMERLDELLGLEALV